MMKLALVVALLALGPLSVAACGGDGDEATAPAPAAAEDTDEPSAVRSDPLVGIWDSGAVPISNIRAAVVANGYTDADLNQVLRYLDWADAKRLRFNLEFYREGDEPFVIQRGWDPAKGPIPTDGDHGPYERLPKHRIAITSADPEIHKGRAVFSYRVDGDRLTLRVGGLTDPSVTANQLRLDKLVLYVATAASLRRVTE